ncbi:hypothetical protein TRIP_B90008 [uncultured Desulfatiglans sp.]|uniref:Uncharacterized protein n=1 Tax=Uncultured Desulfatiglans sp. TaxID=1748965 RepID=A0A653AL94_UNCDX|nr:hypothetical protein TRIP_B90008 [uncultured Desulfatiglans sp.]
MHDDLPLVFAHRKDHPDRVHAHDFRQRLGRWADHVSRFIAALSDPAGYRGLHSGIVQVDPGQLQVGPGLVQSAPGQIPGRYGIIEIGLGHALRLGGTEALKTGLRLEKIRLRLGHLCPGYGDPGFIGGLLYDIKDLPLPDKGALLEIEPFQVPFHPGPEIDGFHGFYMADIFFRGICGLKPYFRYSNQRRRSPAAIIAWAGKAIHRKQHETSHQNG